MMATWMAYSVLVAALLVAGAWAAERALTLYRRPARFAWVVALAGSLLLPAAALVLPSEVPTVAAGRGAPGAPSAVARVLEGLGARAGGTGPGLDALLAAGWLLASAVLVIRVVSARRELASKLTCSTRRQVGGAVVHLTSELGPAVTGILQAEVVLPRWLWRLGPRRRRLAVVHEREHLQAGDPWLLAAARLLVVLVPWNAPLWWGLHRLRLAVEADCDRRVLRTGADRRAYGDLLRVGSRRSRRVPGFAALVERASDLERRIRQMTRSDPKYRRPKAWLAGAMAVAAGLAACGSPAPDPPGPTASEGVSGACEADCTVRVDNRLDTPVEIYLHVTEAGDYLGDVGGHASRGFELPDRAWSHVQLSVREAPGHEFISLECARPFRDGEALAVVEDRTSRERCG